MLLAMDGRTVALKGRLSCLRRTFLSAVSCLTRIALIWCLVQMLLARDVQLWELHT